MAEQGQPSAAGAELVAAAVAGDAEALRALWQAERRWVAAVLLAYKPRHVELDDLLQEVAMALVKSIGNLRSDGSMRSWLRTTAINAARASARSDGSRRRRLSEAHRQARSEAVVHETGSGDETAHIIRAVSELPAGYREPLLLRAVQGLRLNQIADLLGLPATTIETRISRARGMLRERLRGAEERSDCSSRGAIPGARLPATAPRPDELGACR